MRRRRLEELKHKKEIQRKTAEEKFKMMKRRRPNITKKNVALSLIQKHAQIKYNATHKAHYFQPVDFKI